MCCRRIDGSPRALRGPPPACGNSSSWSIHVGHKPVPGTDPGEPRRSLDKRDLATRWNIGRVTLLGDSAHAMVPLKAKGAAQAIGDAAVLGDALAGATSPEVRDALDLYASGRLSIATSAQASCARAGEDHHLPEGLEAQARNPRMAAFAAVRSLSQMTRPAIADLPTADQTHLHHLPHLPRDFLPIRYRAAATRSGHRSMARSDVEELDAALQELARHSSSPRLPHEWKTA
ncbi:FAD-dependent oxidoreductase [Streptomyces mirabilis]|uniref:FAD-dependent oxidoreductase n=1 Tax=Streptomyces mirabilis TaxID=68239 RepID=UPI0033A5F8FE